jgi:uncharacterized protein with GYD domain
MAQYLIQLAYTSDSWATQVRKQGNILERIQPLLEGCHATLNGVFYAFGEYDLVGLIEFPGEEEAAAFSLAVSAGGSVKSMKTTPLLTIEQGLSAMHMAQEAGRNYQPALDTPAHH